MMACCFLDFYSEHHHPKVHVFPMSILLFLLINVVVVVVIEHHHPKGQMFPMLILSFLLIDLVIVEHHLLKEHMFPMLNRLFVSMDVPVCSVEHNHPKQHESLL